MVIKHWPFFFFFASLSTKEGQLSIYRMANLGGGTVRQHTTLAYLVQAAAALVSSNIYYSNSLNEGLVPSNTLTLLFLFAIFFLNK